LVVHNTMRFEIRVVFYFNRPSTTHLKISDFARIRKWLNNER